MEIRFSCFKCGRKLKADPEAAGQSCDCPDCGTALTIPGGAWKPEASFESANPPAWEEPATAAQPDVTQGKFTCPTCWLKFDIGAIMHISVHESLKGDPILGEDVQQRYHAMRFNDKGQSLDAMGVPCTEIACPHCRRRLPIGFLEEMHHIFSLVGDQSAGKSYYLSVLSKMLPGALFQHFGVTMQDADPTGNAALNDMRKSLFAADSPEKVKVVKTQMEGAMYERLPRQGRTVALPRPFIYTMGATASAKERCSVIFYDNAGEHFQPGVRLVEQPGAMHVASASAIFFLFDPFNNPEFRRAMHGTTDPQLEKPLVDQQDIILAEMRSRILNLRRMLSNERISEPMAVMVGKQDAWQHLLPPGSIQYPISNGILDLDIVAANSSQIRSLLLRICPSIVANAESLSSDVCYFPVSAFGHTPVKVVEGAYAPDPVRLKPFQVEIPPLWALSKYSPDLVPSRSAVTKR